MKSLTRGFLLLALTFSLGTAHAARGAKPMVVPEPISVPANTAAPAVVKAVQFSLQSRGWSWTKSIEQPGALDATLNVRQHMLKMRISYASGFITMSYLDSAVLQYDFDGGAPKIHPNASKWMDLLAQDIRTNLARDQLE